MKPKIQNLVKVSCSIFLAICACVGFAQSAAAGAPTGKCGFIASMPHPEIDLYSYAQSTTNPSLTLNMDVLAEIDFTTSTISYSVTQFSYTQGGSTITKATVAGSTSFTLSGPGVNTTDTTPNSYQISFPISLAGTPKTITLNVLPVNSGNTYLIQGIGDRLTGVCQSF